MVCSGLETYTDYECKEVYQNFLTSQYVYELINHKFDYSSKSDYAFGSKAIRKIDFNPLSLVPKTEMGRACNTNGASRDA